jgi:hypothetical protein
VTNMAKLKKKNVIIEDYSLCMGCVNKGDRMAISYSLTWRWRSLKWGGGGCMSGFGSELVGTKCRGASSSNLPRGRLNPQVSQRSLKSDTEHWPAAGSHFQCHVCSQEGTSKQTTTKFQCLKCRVCLYIVSCFRIYYTKINF